MRRLHPASWLALVLALVAVTLVSSNWLVDVLVLAAAIFLAFRHARRLGPSFLVPFAWGAVGMALHVGLAVVAGEMTKRGRVLAFWPEWVVGPGVTLGGAVSEEQLFAGLDRGAGLWTALVLLALLWQVRRPGEWAEAARGAFGRLGQLLEPLIWLGPALEETRGVPRRRRAAAVADTCVRQLDAWGAVAPRTPPRPGRAVLLGGALALGAAAVALATHRSVMVFVTAGQAQALDVPLALGAAVAVWAIARTAFSGTTDALALEDVVALTAAALVGAAAVVAELTGDQRLLTSRPDLTALPWYTLATLGLATAVYAFLGGGERHARA